MSEKLYYDLLRLRNKLKEEHKENGRTPTICNDSALAEMAKLEPKTKDELKNVAGLGKVFIEKYGDQFLEVVNNYLNSFHCNVQLSYNVRETLKELENRLVNISKKNRQLYMSRIYPRQSFDLFSDNFEENENLLKFINHKVKSFKICDKSINSLDEEKGKKDYKKLLTLYREVMKDYRETGEFELYLAYPFVIGKAVGEDFTIRAPLMFFPIEIVKKSEHFEIKRDKTKDVLYNTTLILMHNKFNNINKKLPSNIAENDDYSIETCLKFFAENDLKIQDVSEGLKAFAEYNASTFPNFKEGEVYLEKNAVLGKFSFYSSVIQKDFRDILQSEDINENINDLVKENDDECIYDEETTKKEYPFSEKHIHYINDLNTSQEQAVIKVSYENKLVIQGPPGTGKSQTITSLIADFVCKGQNVLVVSQKKAALDVIYSRLGNLSDFAVICYDSLNKQNFYKQLSKMIYANTEVEVDNNQFNSLSNKIDENVEKLESINEVMFNTNAFNTTPFVIYSENLNNQFIKNKTSVLDYYALIDNRLLSLNYQEILTMFEKFEDKKYCSNVLKYLDIAKKFDWLSYIKENLTYLEQRVFLQKVEEFLNSQTEFLKLNFIKKIFKNKKQKSELNEILKTYFTDNKLHKVFFENPNMLLNGVNNLNTYVETKHFYLELTENEKIYANSLNKISQQSDKINSNLVLKDVINYNFIETIESNNKITFANIDEFNSIVKRINNNITDKKEAVKNKTLNILKKEYNTYIVNSKRYGEIKRIVDGKRKWSVNKFLQKYGFELFKGIKIWMMTPETVSTLLPLEKNLFDLLVFDEASQIYIEKAIPSIARSQKVVISGDHKQLRPSSLGFGRISIDEDEQDEDFEEIAALDEESLLDLARFKYPETLLNFHYRAKYEELINFSNYAFYNARLNVSPNVTTPEKPPIEVIKVDGIWEKRANRKEAETVVSLIKDFLFTRKNNETIGVITFNVNERDLILDLLDDECAKDSKFSALFNKELIRKNNGEDIGLFVKNIENVQGDERDYIIFSLAYAKNKEGKIIRNFGWLNQVGGENRLNVAISRAKQKIHIVTSIFPEELIADDLQNEGPKIFRKYLDYAFAISNNNKDLANQILKSFIDSNTAKCADMSNDISLEIYNILTEKGYVVDKNVGVDNYKIDLVVRNPKYLNVIIAIECDKSAYLLSKNTRDRDVHKQKYLQSRGFRTHRIFTKNWMDNKEKEIEKIISLLNAV